MFGLSWCAEKNEQTLKNRKYNAKLHILCVSMYFTKTEDKQASNIHKALHVFADIVSLPGLHDEVNTLFT